MKKLLYMASTAIILGITVPSNALASLFSSENFDWQEMTQPEQRWVQQILHALEKDYRYDYQALCNQFDAGTLTIKSIASGYLVTLDDGTAADGISIIIIDNF